MGLSGSKGKIMDKLSLYIWKSDFQRNEQLSSLQISVWVMQMFYSFCWAYWMTYNITNISVIILADISIKHKAEQDQM